MKTANLSDFLTDDQIKDSLALYKQWRDGGGFIARVTTEILEPDILSINAKLNQENYPRFLAYIIQYVFDTSFWHKMHEIVS